MKHRFKVMHLTSRMLIIVGIALMIIGVFQIRADAQTMYGRASVYGNDPYMRFIDHGDNNRPALRGASNNRPGIAVYNWHTLGRWYRICWLRYPAARGCRWVRQTDYGPAPWTGRILDLNAIAARKLYHLSARRFPTDEGTWKVVLHGRRLSKSQRRQMHRERRSGAHHRTPVAAKH